MRVQAAVLTALLSSALMCGCGGGSGGTIGGGGNPPAAPTISTTPAQGGAVIVSLPTATAGALIYYTVDGSTPTPASQQYQAPFLVASNLTVKAIAVSGASTTQHGQHGCQPELLAEHSVRTRWSGATSSTSPPVLQLSLIPRSGPTTPATAVLATTNWRPTAPGDRPLRHAARRVPARMWVRTRERMGFCISWHSSRRPRCTPRRG